MKKMNLVLALMMAFGATNAFATSVSVVAGGNYGLTNTSITTPGGTATIKGGFGYGGGLLLGFPMAPTLSLDLGAMYSSNKLTTSVTGLADVATTYNSLHIPATLQIGMGHVLSVGVGGYYDVALSATADNGSTATNNGDYGAQASLRFGIGPKMFFDASYTMGLKDNSGVKNASVLGLLGIALK